MKRFLYKHLGVYRNCNVAELEIIEDLDGLDLTDQQVDSVVEIVKRALDSNFRNR